LGALACAILAKPHALRTADSDDELAEQINKVGVGIVRELSKEKPLGELTVFISICEAENVDSPELQHDTRQLPILV
jgi:hypothetical protein